MNAASADSIKSAHPNTPTKDSELNGIRNVISAFVCTSS